jgi:4-hydroxybenzoate-CoA ligase
MSETFNASTYFVDRHVDEGRGDAIAIECGDGRISYGGLQESVNRFGSLLKNELEVRPEERVLLLTLDGPEMVYAFFGAIKIGAVPVPLNTLWKTTDYDYVLRDARPRVLIVSASLVPRLGASPLVAYPWVRHLVVVGGEAEGGTALAPLLERASPRLEAEPTSADAPA